MIREDVTPDSVFEEIKKYDRVTIAQVAATHDCAKKTIQRRLRILREDGEPILYDGRGLYTVSEDGFVVQDVQKYMAHLMACLLGMARCGKPVQSKQFLSWLRDNLKQLTTKERKAIMDGMKPSFAMLQKLEIDEMLEG